MYTFEKLETEALIVALHEFVPNMELYFELWRKHYGGELVLPYLNYESLEQYGGLSRDDAQRLAFVVHQGKTEPDTGAWLINNEDAFIGFYNSITAQGRRHKLRVQSWLRCGSIGEMIYCRSHRTAKTFIKGVEDGGHRLEMGQKQKVMQRVRKVFNDRGKGDLIPYFGGPVEGEPDDRKIYDALERMITHAQVRFSSFIRKTKVNVGNQIKELMKPEDVNYIYNTIERLKGKLKADPLNTIIQEFLDGYRKQLECWQIARDAVLIGLMSL